MANFLFFDDDEEISQREKYAIDKRDAISSLIEERRKPFFEKIIQYIFVVVFLPLEAIVILLKFSKQGWLKKKEEQNKIIKSLIKFFLFGVILGIAFCSEIESFFIIQIYVISCCFCCYDWQKRQKEERFSEAFIRSGIYDNTGNTPRITNIEEKGDEMTLSLPAISLKMLDDKKEALQKTIFEGGCRIKQILPSDKAHNEAIIKFSNNILKCYYPFQDYIEFFKKQSTPIVLVGHDGDEIVIEQLSKTAYHWKVLGTTRFGKSSWGRSMLLALLLGSSNKIEIHLSDFKSSIEMGLFRNYTGSGIAMDSYHAALLISYLHKKMEERLKKYFRAGVVDIHEYKQKVDKSEKFIVLFIDEFADFIDAVREKYDEEKMRKKKEGGKATNYEQLLVSIGRRSAATGISIFITGQYLTADLLNSNLSNQLSSKICFPVDTLAASVQILNSGDAASLPKIKGRFLYATGSLSEIQGLFISKPDAEKVLRQHVKPIPLSNDFLQFVESQIDSEERRNLLEELREEQIRRQTIISRNNRQVLILNNR